MQDRGMHGIRAMPRYDSPGTRVPRNTIPDRASILQGLCVGLLGPTPTAIRIPREEIVDPPPYLKHRNITLQEKKLLRNENHRRTTDS